MNFDDFFSFLKLQWYGHVSRSSGLAKTTLQGTVKGNEDKAYRGRGGTTTSGNGMDRPGVRQVPQDSGEQGKMEETGSEIIYGVPATLAVKE